MDNMIMSPVNIEVRKGRKRRPSNSLEDDPVMDDCTAALVLMSLSCSPKSTFIPDRGTYSMSVKSIDSGVGYCSAASRSNTPSPTTINEDTTAPIAIEISKNDEQINGLTINKDEGIDMDETIDFIIDDPIQTCVEKARRIVFKCTWRGCGLRCDLVEDIEKHVRIVHLGRSETTGEDDNDHEEEFYYAEIEEEMEIDNISSKESSCSSDSSLGPLSPVSSSPESPNSTNYNLSPTLSSASLLFFAPSPTWSHLDMARPPHEDPEYQKQQKQLQQQQQQQQLQQNQQVQNVNQTILSAQIKPEPERKTVISSPINIPGISVAHRWSTKGRDSSSSSSSFSTSCNSSYSSFSNSQHYTNNHNSHHFNPQNEHQSQASFLASSSSPLSFFSPKAPSKVMRLSCKTSSPVNMKSTSSSPSSSASTANATPSTASVGNVTTTNSSTLSTNFKNASNSSNHHNSHHNHHHSSSSNSNQWTSLLQSSSSSSSSPSKGHSISPTRRSRTETRKCRKVYGMDNRDSWCTQCKWKKACTRFVD